MGKSKAPPPQQKPPPPVASTGIDAGQRAVLNRRRRLKQSGYQDTILSLNGPRNLDPAG